MPEIVVSTVNDFIRYSHGAYTYCPSCGQSRDLDLERMVRLGFGDRPVASLRLRCGGCYARTGQSVRVRIMNPGYRKHSERERPDNVTPIRVR